MKHAVAPILLLITALLTGGCSSLGDTTVMKSSFSAEAYTAQLKFDGKFEVTRINGKVEESRKLQQQMKLVPGTHEIEVIAKEYRLEGIGVIPLTVTDGQVLELTTERDGAELKVVVWDVTDAKNAPVKLASIAMDIEASAYHSLASRTLNQTNGNTPLGR